MRKNPDLKHWIRIVTTQMSHLSKPQAVVLAMWSFGMVMVNSCGLTSVSVFLAQLLGKKENTVRQQLREWYRDSKDKKGKKRSRTRCHNLLWTIDAVDFAGMVGFRKATGTGC